jgi:hypothetical protein
MNKSPVSFTDILTDREIERKQKRLVTSQNKVDQLYASGYWLKKYVISELNRAKQTVYDWEQILISLVPDYAEGWRERKPLSDYHRWCLQKVNRFQNKEKPYKSESEIISFIERTDFSLQKYIELRATK